MKDKPTCCICNCKSNKLFTYFSKEQNEKFDMCHSCLVKQQDSDSYSTFPIELLENEND